MCKKKFTIYDNDLTSSQLSQFFACKNLYFYISFEKQKFLNGGNPKLIFN